MSIQLYSIDQAPRTLPIWQTLLDDLCDPPVRRVARVLRVSQRSVHRWNQAGQAPWPAMMALYWLTRWGRSEVNARAVNDAMLAVAYVESLKREIGRLEANVVYLSRLGSGSANEPLQLLGGRHVR